MMAYFTVEHCGFAKSLQKIFDLLNCLYEQSAQYRLQQLMSPRGQS